MEINLGEKQTELDQRTVPFAKDALVNSRDEELWNKLEGYLATAEPVRLNINLDTDGSPEKNEGKYYFIKSSDGDDLVIFHSVYVSTKGRSQDTTRVLSKDDLLDIKDRIEEDARYAKERISFLKQALVEATDALKLAREKFLELRQMSIEKRYDKSWYLIPKEDTGKFPDILDDEKPDLEAIKAVFRDHPELIISVPIDNQGDPSANRVDYTRKIPAVTEYGREISLNYYDHFGNQGYQCNNLYLDRWLESDKDEFKGYRSSIKSLSEAVEKTSQNFAMLERVFLS